MSLYAIVLIAALLTLTLYGIVIHKGLAELRRSVNQAWIELDALIRQRHDLLADLKAVCDAHPALAPAALQCVMEARSQVLAAAQTHDVAALASAEIVLREGLAALFSEAENRAPLRQQPAYLSLKERLSVIETSITARGTRYDGAVDLHNARIEHFPDVVVARMLEVQAKTALRLRPIRPEDSPAPAPNARHTGQIA